MNQRHENIPATDAATGDGRPIDAWPPLPDEIAAAQAALGAERAAGLVEAAFGAGNHAPGGATFAGNSTGRTNAMRVV